MVDDVTTLPSLFVTIYGRNELSKKSLGIQENIYASLRFFYVYYFKKHKVTFDYAFHKAGYDISEFIDEFNGFFKYLLGKQHLNNLEDIVGLDFLYSGITKSNKVTYGNHIRNVSGFFRYLNIRYMNTAYQDLTPHEAHIFSKANREKLEYVMKDFNSIEVAQNAPVHRYKSISEKQNVELNNMLIPSTPAFADTETGEYFEEVDNPQNPFKDAFQQYRNYLIHRLMFAYGLRVGEVLLASLDSIGETQDA
ncbi:hypothetical protein CTM94_01695 [Photobacterium leiognathi]|uniref:Site-specific integrase n=2 Tax=Photobacterium leiognathi TaxID=553611 RepID=A0ABX5GLF8_PHOLE|nr:hypothetical protein CTM94_01695 [Photobacterium leiognathi]